MHRDQQLFLFTIFVLISIFTWLAEVEFIISASLFTAISPMYCLGTCTVERGGVILAAVAAGCFENVEAAAEAIVRKKDTTMPSPQLVEKYEKGYATFKQFYPALKGKY